jgi:hypothetical protein
MALTIGKKHNQYRSSKTGTIVFVYTVDGTKEDIANYKKAQGANYREDNGTPLFFSAGRTGNAGDEIHFNTKKSTYQLHTDLESEVATLQTATANALGKINAIQQFTGMSKAQMQERLLSAFAS